MGAKAAGDVGNKDSHQEWSNGDNRMYSLSKGGEGPDPKGDGSWSFCQAWPLRGF